MTQGEIHPKKVNRMYAPAIKRGIKKSPEAFSSILIGNTATESVESANPEISNSSTGLMY
jgi:hypothetical protein